MTNIKIKERKNIMADNTESATIIKNSMKHESILYVITEQYGKRNPNEKNHGTTRITYITALKREWKAVQA